MSTHLCYEEYYPVHRAIKIAPVSILETESGPRVMILDLPNKIENGVFKCYVIDTEKNIKYTVGWLLKTDLIIGRRLKVIGIHQPTSPTV